MYSGGSSMKLLVLRRAQLEAFAEASSKALSGRVFEHAVKFFPAARESRGDAGLLREIDDSLARARALGFTTEQDLCKFADLRLAFGAGFEEEPWAREILAARQDPRRMYRLMGAALAAEGA